MIIPDRSNQSEKDFSGKDFSRRTFLEIDFHESVFNGAHFDHIVFDKCNLKHTEFTESMFSNCHFIDCQLDYSDFVYTKSDRGQFNACSFSHIEWRESTFSDNTFSKCTFYNDSNKDRILMGKLLEGLNDHLSNKRDYEYSIWSDRAIDTGSDWQEEINYALKKSDAAILLVSASFANSKFIRQFELAEFFRRKREKGFLILPVLVRRYDFKEFEGLSSLNFFKTYSEDYGLSVAKNNAIMPFDVLGEGVNISNRLLNDYYYNLASYIHTSVKNFFNERDK